MNIHFRYPTIKLFLYEFDKLMRFHWSDFNNDCDFAPVIFGEESTFQLDYNSEKC